MSKRENRIQKALIDIDRGHFRSLRQAAAFYSIPLSTLSSRNRGRKARLLIDLNSIRLSFYAESVVI